MRPTQHKGFTLIELMVVVAVIAIVTMIALPTYQDYVRKGNRASAQGFLASLAQQQNQYFIDNRGYMDSATATTLNYLPAPASVSNHYTITIALAGPPPSYTLTATRIPASSQAQDACGDLSINSAGTKTSTAGSNCW